MLAPMFLDARQFPAGTALQADLCIVGAGAAGITMAHALRGRGMRVLLLESGGLEWEEATQALYVGEVRGAATDATDVSRLRYFGGSTNHWAGWCRPLEAHDFRPPDPDDVRTWPISRDALVPYYAGAQALCELGPPEYENLEPWLAAAKLSALALDPARLQSALFQVGPPTRFGTTYRTALEQAGNIEVVLHANVLEVQANATASQVVGVRARSMGGAEFTVAARVFVLAAGGIENARLLLLSNQVQPAGLGNGNDVVGRYFMDHPWLLDMGFLAFSQPAPDLRFYFDETAARGTMIFGALSPGLPGAAAPPLGFRVLLRPSRRIVEGVNALKSIGGDIAALRLPKRFWYNLGQVFADYDAVIDSAYKTIFNARGSIFGAPEPGQGPIVGAQLDVNIEQMPNPDSRVTLSRNRDALGQNRVVLDWRLGEAEKRTMERAVALVGLEFGRMGLGRARARALPAGGGWPADMRGSSHHMGTTRMSDSPRTGVVDANCRVHGVENLYIAGSSVFASSGFANPTLTIVALALRLADELARRVR